MTAKAFNYHKDDIEDHLEFESKATSKCHECGTMSTIHNLTCPNCSTLLRRSESSMWSNFSSHPTPPRPVEQTSELVKESEHPAKNIKLQHPVEYRRGALANDLFDEYPWPARYGREEIRNLKQVPLTSGERGLYMLVALLFLLLPLGLGGLEKIPALNECECEAIEGPLNWLAQGFITFVMLLPYLLFLFVLICRKPSGL